MFETPGYQRTRGSTGNIPHFEERDRKFETNQTIQAEAMAQCVQHTVGPHFSVVSSINFSKLL